ncbi:MAG: TolC family protein [Planctomycetes bacterium]|nr:TolC family protein [Planctomycetota bacterium]
MPAPEPSFGAPWDSELTLEQLEEIALATNPSVIEARARVSAAHGKWVQVGLPPNTVVGYSGQQLSSHGLAEQQGIYVGQEIVRGHKLKLNRAIVDQEIVMAEQRAFAQEQRVLTDVRLGYYDVLIAQRRLEVTQELVAIATDAYQTAEALFKALDVSRVDVMRSRGALQMAQLLGKNAANLQHAAWTRLTSVLGTTGIPLQSLSGDVESITAHIDQNEMLQRLLADSPEIAVAVAEIERAQWAIDRAYAEPIPNIDIQAIFQSDNGTGSSNGNLQISMPIPWLNRNQGGIRQAEYELTAAEHAVAKVELSLQRRLATIYQRYANARNQVEDYSKADGILDNYGATLEFVRMGYEGGEIAYLDLLTAQTTFSQTNLAYIEALGELWAATVEIEGLLLKDSLNARVN